MLSGNQVDGDEHFGGSNWGNVTFSNKIGTDAGGNKAIPNGTGVLLTDGAFGDEIGGPFGGNIISGNTQVGVSIGLAGYGSASYNFVQGNIIGLNGAQNGAIGAGVYGISINSGSGGNAVQGNVVCAASSNGIILSSTQSNNVSYNWIGEDVYGYGFLNGQYGVALVGGANYNYVLNNSFGWNYLGPIYVATTAYNNDVQ